MQNDKKLKGRDLINIGIYGAISMAPPDLRDRGNPC